LSETRRVLLQLLRPALLQAAQLLLHFLQNRGRRGNGRLALGIRAHTHGLSSLLEQTDYFPVPLKLPENAIYVTPFWEWTRPELIPLCSQQPDERDRPE